MRSACLGQFIPVEAPDNTAVLESMVGTQHTCIHALITRYDIIWKLRIKTVLIIYFKYNTIFNVLGLSIIPARRHSYWNSAPSNYIKLLTTIVYHNIPPYIFGYHLFCPDNNYMKCKQVGRKVRN